MQKVGIYYVECAGDQVTESGYFTVPEVALAPEHLLAYHVWQEEGK
jgi:hypothetical protein